MHQVIAKDICDELGGAVIAANIVVCPSCVKGLISAREREGSSVVVGLQSPLDARGQTDGHHHTKLENHYTFCRPLGSLPLPDSSAVNTPAVHLRSDPQSFLARCQTPPSRRHTVETNRNAGQEHFLCSFGSGPRSCIGSKLTDVFLKEACMYLLKHYDWCLDPPSQDLEYKWLPVSRPSNPPTMSFTQLDQTRSDKSDTS
ncbi:uncharacterized protein AKAME5_002669200 [Lates japonicus]|uniref:Cytochrome P450 n=1 Tax=Lates japonicus TaxID=270547 RepID=A0AAD3NLR5_LATJO|nr:uncharacterized protein AKAME5_002669200 [Lates japonicus]